ncbi:MAG TPA: alpha/beta fold hydrolase [Candidatus Sulfotelmatobacter sp.]|nr:alpha/beta fold hydrolase [Candidatus Sulfotelmatobacter sp.]
MRLRRRLRRLFVALAFYLALCGGAGIFLADAVLHPARRPLTQAEIAAFTKSAASLGGSVEDISITTPDGALLRAWLVRPTHPNGDAAVVLHGLADNRIGMEGYAELLLSHGFTILMPDARGHGESGGVIVTYGLLERNDIHQWVSDLSARIHPRCVYGLAESMGAAELLQSLAVATPFCAVVAESSFATFREIAYDRMGQPFHLGPWIGRTIFRPIVESAFLRARCKYGLDMTRLSPEDAVAHSRVPVLLIHGAIDSNIPVRHSRLIRQHDPQAVFWEVPGADHCGAIAVAPREFESRVLGFFHDGAAFALDGRHAHPVAQNATRVGQPR